MLNVTTQGQTRPILREPPYKNGGLLSRPLLSFLSSTVMPIASLSPVSGISDVALFPRISSRVDKGMFRSAVLSALTSGNSALRVFEQGAKRTVNHSTDHPPRTVREAAFCEALCASHHPTLFDAHLHLELRSFPCFVTQAGEMFVMRCTQFATLYTKVLTPAFTST